MRRVKVRRWRRRSALLGLALCATAGEAAEWPAFRGRDGDGRSPEMAVFPSSGAVGLTVRWKRPLGSGYSGIAVADGRLFTLFSDGTDDRLIALDAESGAILWQQPIAPTYAGHDGSHSGPLSTPATGSKRVHALGPRGELIAARVESGEILWRKDLIRDHQVRKPHYGFSASPRLLGNVLVLPLGGHDRAIAGFDARTGALKWSVGTDSVTYQSPIVWPPGSRHRMVVAGNAYLFGLDTRRGSVLWQHPHEGFGTRGAYSLSPVAAGPDRLLLTHRDDSSSLIEIDRKAGSMRQLWESRSIRNSYALPVYHAGDVYAYSNRFLTCIEAATGDRRWRSRAPGDGFPILVDGHLMIQTKQGGLHLARATPAGYEERAALPLFATHSWTSPSFADGAIYCRGLSEIARVDPVAGATDQPQPPDGPASQLLRDLEGQLRNTEDPKAVVDANLSRWLALGAPSPQSSFPIVEDGTAHFIYRGKAHDVALAGDLPGARREWPLVRLDNTDLFVRSVSLEPDAAISYLFLVDYAPTPDPLNPRQVQSSVYSPELEPIHGGDLAMSWLAMPGWQEPEYLRPTVQPRGTLEQAMLPSRILNREVGLTIYRPVDYAAGTRQYPVAYIFGGQGALERGGFPQALDNLIGEAARPLIAVFILEDGFGVLSLFADMFASELVPFIDSTYRTLATPASRASIGMGWEALTAAYCTLRRPGIAGKMALQSLYALTAPEGGPVAWLGDPKAQPLEVYLDWGRYDLRNSLEAWSMAEDSRRFFEAMQQLGYEPTGGEVNAGAGWASWRNRTHRWLTALFPANR